MGKKTIRSRMVQRVNSELMQTSNEAIQLEFDFYSDKAQKLYDRPERQISEGEQAKQLMVKQMVREPMRMLSTLSHLTVLQRRVYWLILYQVKHLQYRNVEDAKDYKSLTFHFHATDIINNDTNWSVTYLRKVVDDLSNVSVKWQDNKGIYTNAKVFPFAQYIPGKKIIVLQVQPMLIPGMLQLGNNFSQYELDAALKLTSQYAQLLYAYMCRHVWRKKWLITLDELRTIMGLSEMKAYDEFSNLRIRILDPAVDQLQTHCGLKITYVTLTQGRKVIALDFSIQLLDEKAQIEEKSREKLKENLAIIQQYSLEEKRLFAQETMRSYYRSFTLDQQRQILENQLLLERFCVAECYVMSGQVNPESHDNYVLKSVFNPDTPAKTSSRKS
ncbi:RepB family plasmid replication initiator protein [Spirosoma gilvum]